MRALPHCAEVATRVLFAATGVLWLLVAGLTATRLIDIGPVSPGVVNPLAAIMCVAALVMGFFGWRVLRGNRLVDGAAVASAVVNVALTFTDDVGAYDLAYLAVALVLLVSLIVAVVSARGGKVGEPHAGQSGNKR